MRRFMAARRRGRKVSTIHSDAQSFKHKMLSRIFRFEDEAKR
jgi:hypothetical protein